MYAIWTGLDAVIQVAIAISVAIAIIIVLSMIFPLFKKVVKKIFCFTGFVSFVLLIFYSLIQLIIVHEDLHYTFDEAIANIMIALILAFFALLFTLRFYE